MNQRNIRNHRKQNKDKVIMIVSSAFVLMALTMTGVYLKDKEIKNLDEDYSIDFTKEPEDEEENYVMREDVTPPPSQIVDSAQVQISGLTDGNATGLRDGLAGADKNLGAVDGSLADGSLVGLEESLGITDGTLGMEAQIGQQVVEEMIAELENAQQELAALENSEEDLFAMEEEITDGSDEVVSDPVVSQNVEVMANPTFSTAEGLLMPVEGMVLMEYSVDATIYHATLDQYRYNDALVISSREGNAVKSCADGKVIEIGKDTEFGDYVKMDLGNGYVATYGQLAEIRANVGDTLDSGVAFAKVAAPTKYYSVEGSNLYFKLEQNGVSTDPEVLFR